MMSPRTRLFTRHCIEAGGRFYAREFHELIVRKLCPIPATGAAILVCNHTSGLDPVMIQAAVPRFITWMMAREYFDMKSMQWGFEALETIPVDRGNRDLAATRAALRALEAGKLLGVFPEGRIEPTRELLPFFPGVAMLARRGRAAIFPCFLDGTQRGKGMLEVFKSPQRVTIAFGPAITPTNDLEASTEAIRKSVEMLKQATASD